MGCLWQPARRCLDAFPRAARAPLPVVSGRDAMKAFRKRDMNSMSNTVVTSFFAMPTRLTDAFPFPTIKNWPKELFERWFERPGSRWKSSRVCFNFVARPHFPRTIAQEFAASSKIRSCSFSSEVLGSLIWIWYITPFCCHHRFAGAQEPPHETGLNIPMRPFANFAWRPSGRSRTVEPPNPAANAARLPVSEK